MGKALVLTVLLLLGASLVADDISDATHVQLGTAITIFGLAFGAWAIVLGYVMVIIRREFHELREFVRKDADFRRQADERAHQDRLAIERRITEIESAWRYSHSGANND